jgi:dTDP-L-rhamnose 4-epimerase
MVSLYDKNVKILISGGAGFIGSRLGTRLKAVGNVVAFDSLHPQVHSRSGTPADLDSQVHFFPGDVVDPSAWDRLFLLHGLPDVIVHLAAETGTGQSLREASRHGSVNVVGTTQLTDALSRHGHVPKHIVLSSSRAVYGEGEWIDSNEQRFYPGPRTQTQLEAARWEPESALGGQSSPVPHRASQTWPRPSNVYAATKLAQEHVLESWCASFGVPLSILRLQNVYGPGQAVGNAYTGVLTFFAKQLSTGQQLDVYEDGNIVRDFVYVDDVVSAICATIELPPAGVRRVDIGGGEPATLLQVAQIMSEASHAEAPFVSGRYRHGDVRAASADITDARSELRWAPRTELNVGLRNLLDWVPLQI